MNKSDAGNGDCLLKAAYEAARFHGQQKRKDGKTPYINHPLEVAWILSSKGQIRDQDILAAALLHDTLEDTEMTSDYLVREFNPRIASYVAEVTDDKSLSSEERKSAQIEKAPLLSSGARLIKIADKIANVKALTKEYPLGWDLERKRKYILWAEMVIEKIRNTHEGLESLFRSTAEEVKKKLKE